MRINFLFKLKNEYVSPANFLFFYYGGNDLSALCEKYDITQDSLVITRTHKIWNAFADSIYNK
jgi:hypothetical protein